jgi:hypothetical protein
LGSDKVVMARGDSTIIARLREVVRAGDEESEAITVNADEPAVVGVPVMAPVASLRSRPAGRAPAEIAQL